MASSEDKQSDNEALVDKLLDDAFSKTGAEFDEAVDALPKEVTEDLAFIMVGSCYTPQ
jgi:hypothetical protein|tara:strand:+ start:392984 stop:393157 length:174 start_codon:yes stop_codon:yes gene_type:complete